MKVFNCMQIKKYNVNNNKYIIDKQKFYLNMDASKLNEQRF